MSGVMVYALAGRPVIYFRTFVPLADETKRTHLAGVVAGIVGAANRHDQRAIAVAENRLAEISLVIIEEIGIERIGRVEVATRLIAKLLRIAPCQTQIVGGAHETLIVSFYWFGAAK